MNVSVKSIQGKRDYMEDRFAYIDYDGIIVAMVCDGHGGFTMAHKTAKILPRLLLNAVEDLPNLNNNVNIAKTIREKIIEWGDAMRLETDGSTLTGILIVKGVCFVYNTGDSRTSFELKHGSQLYQMLPIFDKNGEFINLTEVSSKKSTFFYTRDHTPNDEIEKVRIENSGGKIVNDRVNGILSVSRALGDHNVGKGVSFIPDIYWTNHINISNPIIMYSDGIYENKTFTPEHIYSIAKDTMDATQLVKAATSSNSGDNLTVLLLS